MTLKFLPVTITRQDLVAAARYFEGVKYSQGTTLATESIDRSLWQCDCAGFAVLTAVRAGLLPPSFPVGLPRSTFGDRSEVLNELLLQNFERIEMKERRPGDLLRLKIYDGRERHIAMFTEWEPEPYGSIIHATNTARLRVYEQRLTALEMQDITKAYRLKQFVERGI